MFQSPSCAIMTMGFTNQCWMCDPWASDSHVTTTVHWFIRKLISRLLSSKAIYTSACMINSKSLPIGEISMFIDLETSQITNFIGPTWGPPGSCRPQMGPMLAPWTLLSGVIVTPVIAWDKVNLRSDFNLTQNTTYLHLIGNLSHQAFI